MRIANLSNSLKPARRYLKNIKATDVDRSVCWVMPMSFVPMLRTLGDKDKDKRTRKELFLRDFSAYTISCMAFYTGRSIAKKAMTLKPIAKHVKNMSTDKKSVFQSLVGGTFSVVWSGIGALKLSKALANAYKEPTPRPTDSFKGAHNNACFKNFNKKLNVLL